VTSFYRYQVEDDHGGLLETQVQERPAQQAARRRCSELLPVVRVFRCHAAATPRRVQVFVASWNVATASVLGCETYTIV
jgi:hypothetical protein